MKKSLCVFALCLLSLQASAKEIVVAQVAPYTGSGGTVGLHLKYGIQLYLEGANRAGGVNGTSIILVTKEREPDGADKREGGSAADPLSVVEAARQVAKESKPIAFIGLMGTNSMQKLIKEKALSDIGIPVVGIRTGSVALHDPINPLLFHTRASYATEAEKTVTYLQTIGYKRFAIVTEKSAFGRESARHFEAALFSRGLTVVNQEIFDQDGIDIPAAIGAMAVTRPDAVLVAGASNAIADLYKAVRQKDKSIPVVTLSTVDGAEVIKRIGKDAAHGLGIARVVPDPRNARSAIVREFQAAGKRLKGAKHLETQAALEGFIAAKVLVHALKQCGPDCTSKRLVSELENMRSLDLGDMYLGFSRTDHSGSKYVDVGIIGRDGRVLH